MDDACVLYTGSLDRNGYGKVGAHKHGTRLAHRIAYTEAKGPIPPGLEIDHLCFNRACIEPKHLEAVTHRENVRRGKARITHCPQGHPYAGGNLYVPPSGQRVCRECGRDYQRRWYWRMKRDG